MEGQERLIFSGQTLSTWMNQRQEKEETYTWQAAEQFTTN